MKLFKGIFITILCLTIFAPFQLLTAKAEEEVKRAECSMTIVSDKHTSIDKAATANGVCKDVIYGYFITATKEFVIVGMTNKTVKYSGQKFVIGLPHSNYGEANLTVYTVLNEKKSAPPKQDNSKSQNNQPKKSNEPKKTSGSTSTNQQKKVQSDKPTKSTQQKQSQSQTSKPTKSTAQTNQQKSTSVSERANVTKTNETSQNKSETETPEVKKESSNDVKNEEKVENHKEDTVKENKNDKKAEKKNVEKEESGINKKAVVAGVVATTGALAVGGGLWFLKFRKVW